MTLFDVFSGDNTGEQQFAGATEPAGDLTPAAQPQVTGGEAKQAETAEQSQTQSSTDTTAPAQSAPITPQPSDTEARSEMMLREVSRWLRRKLLKRKICLTVKRL